MCGAYMLLYIHIHGTLAISTNVLLKYVEKIFGFEKLNKIKQVKKPRRMAQGNQELKC